tara:strand:+ start:1760 stop:2731 length:972 start_codon:yes stop_codon:yes gene_type:complete
MKIIHLVLSDVFAGIEQHVDELSLMQQRDCDVTILCNKSIASKFGIKNVVSIENFNRRSLIGLFRLYSKIKSISPDIVHTHGSKTATVINNIKKFIKVKHVASIHGIKNNISMYEKADKIIAVSNLAKESLNIESVVVKNWWSPSLPDQLELNKKYALAVGRLEKVKGFDLLIQSWVGIESNLVIVGSGNEKSNLLGLIKSNSLENKITIIDEINFKNLIEHYKNASILIISSRNEGGPRVALEALHLKIPVISTNVGHMSDILPNELLAIPDNLESLKSLIQANVGNDFMNQDAIFKYVSEEYSLPTKNKEVLKIYEELLVS